MRFVSVFLVGLALCGCHQKPPEQPAPDANRKTDKPKGDAKVDTDQNKCQALKNRLGPEQYGQVVPIAEFFDGNADPASIGCNLTPHPGIDNFRNVLTGLVRNQGVEAVYAIISELDPGEDSWPFTDTVLVVGKISVEELRAAVGRLQPDEVRIFEADRIPRVITERHKAPVLVVWWD